MKKKTLPERCVCLPGVWHPPIPSICPKYEGSEGSNCRICAHDAGCHEETMKPDKVYSDGERGGDLLAKRAKLCIEADELCAEGYKLLSKGVKLRKMGDKLLADFYKPKERKR